MEVLPQDVILFPFSLSNFSCLKTGTVPVSFSGEFLTETYYVVSSVELLGSKALTSGKKTQTTNAEAGC